MKTFNDAENIYDELKIFIDDIFYKYDDIKIEYDFFEGNMDQENYSINITSEKLNMDLITITIDCYSERDEEDKETIDIKYSYENILSDNNIIDYNGNRFLNSVKNDISKLFTINIYSTVDKSDEILIKLPIFNEEYYNEWIDHILKTKPHLVKWVDFNNLNDFLKTKWEYLFNANKFDLI
jgi:hypothetical protein